MMHDDNFLNNKSDKLVLSFELLCLLHWLAQHETPKLKKIIAKALTNGLSNELQKIDTIDTASDIQFLTENAQDALSTFAKTIEKILQESIAQHTIQKARQKNLLTAIDQIDTSVCDDATVRFSVEKVTQQLDREPDSNPNEQLFKEILKRWNPSNKNLLN